MNWMLLVKIESQKIYLILYYYSSVVLMTKTNDLTEVKSVEQIRSLVSYGQA